MSGAAPACVASGEQSAGRDRGAAGSDSGSGEHGRDSGRGRGQQPDRRSNRPAGRKSSPFVERTPRTSVGTARVSRARRASSSGGRCARVASGFAPAERAPCKRATAAAGAASATPVRENDVPQPGNQAHILPEAAWIFWSDLPVICLTMICPSVLLIGQRLATPMHL